MNSYEQTRAFDLFIVKKGQKEKVEKHTVANQVVLPKSKKEYKVTLKNVKVYIEELMELNPEIEAVEIYRISFSGLYKRKTNE